MGHVEVRLDDQLSMWGAADLLEDLGWFVPPYLQLGFLGSETFRIAGAPRDRQQDLLGDMLLRAYDKAGVSPMIIECYPRTPHVRDHTLALDHATRAHFLGLHAVVAPTLLPVVEDVLRKAVGGKKEGAKGWAARLVAAERKRQKTAPMDERMRMIEGFERFISSRLFAHTSRASDPWKLNRPGILHGFVGAAEFAVPQNYGRLMSVIDMLAWAIMLDTGKGCMLAPGATPASGAYARSLLGFDAAGPRRSGL